MLIALKTLRDFLNAEQLKWLPGNLRVGSCIMLRQTVERDGLTTIVLQIFDSEGTYIGEIAKPEWIPQGKP